MLGSNQRHPGSKPSVLPTELTATKNQFRERTKSRAPLRAGALPTELSRLLRSTRWIRTTDHPITNRRTTFLSPRKFGCCGKGERADANPRIKTPCDCRSKFKRREHTSKVRIIESEVTLDKHHVFEELPGETGRQAPGGGRQTLTLSRKQLIKNVPCCHGARSI